MTEQHTPGPWAIESRTIRELGGLIVARIDDGGHLVNENEIPEAEQRANAYLIAAAPELLAALEIVANSGKFSCFDDTAWDQINNAIAKANRSNQP